MYAGAPRQIAEKTICGIFLPKNIALILPKILLAELQICRFFICRKVLLGPLFRTKFGPP
jgi:hypothetical protein